MQIKALELPGVYEIDLVRIRDERGYFLRCYDRQIFADHGLQTEWEHDSISFNARKNTVRGLHFQLPPYTEAKIVRVLQGAIFDVFVDLRRDSASFGKWDSLELSAENDVAVYIPKGFAHGFRTLTDNTAVQYKIDMPYSPESASGIRWNDSDVAIEWNVSDPILSERDAGLTAFRDFNSPF